MKHLIAMLSAVLLTLASNLAFAACPADAPLSCSAGWCCPYGEGNRTDVCCNSNPESEGCTTNGSCSNTTTNTQCTGDSIPTQDSCGESSCSCAASCGSNSDCESGCCANGYCALACTCQGGTSVTYNCGTANATTKSPGGGGCAVSGSSGSSSEGVLAGLGIYFAFAMMRKRVKSRA